MTSSLFKTFQKNILPVLLVDILFLGIFALFGFFVRMKLKAYLLAIQSYSPALAQVQDNEVVIMEKVLGELQRTLTTTYLFAFVLIPAGIFILYVVFQGLSWSLILQSFKEKMSRKQFWKTYPKYEFKFFSLYLIPFVLLSLFFYVYVTKGFSEQMMVLSLILLCILFYFAFLFSLALFQHSWKEGFRRGFRCMKHVLLFPLFLLLLFFSVVLLATLTVVFLGVWYLIFFLILDLLIIEFLRFFFVSLLEKKV